MPLIRLLLVSSVLMGVYAGALTAANVEYGWVVPAVLLALVLARRTKHYVLSSHGTARWAEPSDLMGMLDKGTGLILGLMENRIGRLDGLKALFNRKLSSGMAVTLFLKSMQRKQKPSLVRLNNVVHTSVFAPTGAGKGVSHIVPFLLTNPDSMVVLDYKGENFKLTAEVRRKMGHRVVCLDPFGMVGGKDTLNPLDTIGGADDPNALDDIASMSKALVLRTGEEKEPHWNDLAETFIRAITGFIAAEADPDERNLQTLRPLLCNKEKLEAASKLIQASVAWGGGLSLLGHQLTHAGEREAGSILTTVNRHTSWMDSPQVVNNLKTSSFNPRDLCRGKMTIYLVLHPKYQTSHAALLRLWIDTLMRVVISQGLSSRKVHVVLDEAASLGRMESIESALDKYRGYGIRLLFFYQSIGQLKKNWPEGQETTLLSNTTQCFYGVADQQTAEFVSNSLGSYTQIVTSGGSSRGGSTSRSTNENGTSSSSYSSSWNGSDNWSQSGRRLLTPDEVRNLDPRQCITFTPGCRPILTWLIRYYEGIPRTKLGVFKVVADTIALFLLAVFIAAVASAKLNPDLLRRFDVEAFRIAQ